MKLKKWAALAATGALAASLALFGCSSGSNDAKGDAKDKAEEPATASYTRVQDGTLTIATSPDYPPFENLEGDKAVGLDIDIAQAIADDLGLTLEVKPLQFDGILTAIAAGGQADLGISGFTVDPERAKTVDFSETYYIDDLAVAAMKGGTVNKDNAAEELNKENVIIMVQSGTSGASYCKENFPNATIKEFGNSVDAFAAMQAGQDGADCYVCTNYAVVKKMLANAYSDAEIVLPIATGEEYAIAVSKDNPELLKAVNASIEKLKQDGTIDELTNKWLG